jgi:hypothetical protein
MCRWASRPLPFHRVCPGALGMSVGPVLLQEPDQRSLRFSASSSAFPYSKLADTGGCGAGDMPHLFRRSFGLRGWLRLRHAE